MKFRPLYAVALAVLMIGSGAVGAPSSNIDAIRKLETQQEAAWNAHDAHAYAQLFTEDADTINVLGWWWKSRAELEQKLGDAFASVFANSILHIEDVSVRSLSDVAAIAHVRWSMTGAISPNGSSAAPERGIQTQVLKRVSGQWRIIAFHNTNSLPERPFPKSPIHR